MPAIGGCFEAEPELENFSEDENGSQRRRVWEKVTKKLGIKCVERPEGGKRRHVMVTGIVGARCR